MFRTALLVLLLAVVGPLLAEGGALGDPTRPTVLGEGAPAASRAAGPRWRLQSTLVAADRRVAVINGRRLHTGDAIDGATLVEIRQDGVTLEIERRRLDLRLVPQTARVRKGRD